MWLNRMIHLPAYRRGYHLITQHIEQKLPEIAQIKVGQLTLLLQHTSASISINENADATVRADFEEVFNRLIPEDQPYYQHNYEGSDDLPAHIKSGILGVNLVIPIAQGTLQLGTWQGIYLGEHRNHAGSRTIAALLQGA